MASILPPASFRFFTGQPLQHPQEHPPLVGTQFTEPPLLAPLNVGLHGVLDGSSGVGDRQQPHAAVVGVRPTLDVPTFLQLVEGADDAGLVGVDRLGERRLRPHRRPIQRKEDDVTPHGKPVFVEDGLLGSHQLAQQRCHHGREVGAAGRLGHRIMVGVALLYACTYRRCMPTNSYELLPHHRTAVLASVDVVNTVRRDDVVRPTPCAGWTLLDLIAHMTVQHRGFAAAARGSGSDPDFWRPETVLASVTADPAGAYTAAAHDVLDAFAADGVADVDFALPDFGPGATVPGAMAMGFHFVDYVVHGWDVAAALGVPFKLPADVVAAVLPLALAVPDGDFREQAGAPFARAVAPSDAEGLDAVLRHLGRRPDWSQAYSTVTGA
jgi:uncharacterized protein (TIGR03086 family)